MNKYTRIIQTLFGIPWLVFGLQHFLYGEFVATLVPAFVPFKLFWAYFTGAAMIAAGISLIVNRFARLAAMFLGLMLTLFVLMIHVPALVAKTLTVAAWTRPVQDIALACASFLLAKTFFQNKFTAGFLNKIALVSRYLFAVALVGFGVQQFYNLDFLTAKIPLYFPLRIFSVYLMGAAFIAAGISVFVNRKAQTMLTALGMMMLIASLLNHVFLLAMDVHQPLLWTAAMLDWAVTAGVFVLANSSRRETFQSGETLE